MIVTKIEVIEIGMTRRRVFLSSRARVDRRRIILVAVHDRDGATGWGECSAPEEPRHCEEWTNGAWEAINTILAPAVLTLSQVNASGVRDQFLRYRGNNMAKAVLETALWDLQAHQEGKPLWEILGGTSEPVPCGVALGFAATLPELLESVRQELESGYRRIKLKVGPGWDREIARAVRRDFPDASLMVDANGAYNSGDSKTLLDLDALGLMMIEQPFAPDDLSAGLACRGLLRTPICLDETVVSDLFAKAVLELELCQVVNVKLGRVGGYTEAQEIIRRCRESDIPVWCGGQHEAGIGRAHAIALASLMPRTIPSEISASTRYWAEDIIIPEITVLPGGYVQPPTGAGIGYDVNRSLIDRATQRRVVHHR